MNNKGITQESGLTHVARGLPQKVPEKTIEVSIGLHFRLRERKGKGIIQGAYNNPHM